LLTQLLTAIILGLIQGLAEWLPISSTAHLRVAEHFLGLAATPLLNVALHIATLIVVVFYFRGDVKGILSALARLDFKSEYGRLMPPIIMATIPTGIIGLLYVEFLEGAQIPLSIGMTLLVGATIVYSSKTGKEDRDAVTYQMALAMGVAQGLASFPGLSRSGVTISTALLLGLKRERAYKFSFLLSIPAIIGDLGVEAYKQRGQLLIGGGMGSLELLMALAVTMIAGYIAIELVSSSVRGKKFHFFAFYTWLLGITLIALALDGL
jgi:undecaprenyl-diphosphatase